MVDLSMIDFGPTSLEWGSTGLVSIWSRGTPVVECPSSSRVTFWLHGSFSPSTVNVFIENSSGPLVLWRKVSNRPSSLGKDGISHQPLFSFPKLGTPEKTPEWTFKRVPELLYSRPSWVVPETPTVMSTISQFIYEAGHFRATLLLTCESFTVTSSFSVDTTTHPSLKRPLQDPLVSFSKYSFLSTT